MATLFDLGKFHVEPEPDPNQPTVSQCLELISEAEREGDAEYISMLQHWLFRQAAHLYSEADYQRIFERREQAAERLRGRVDVLEQVG